MISNAYSNVVLLLLLLLQHHACHACKYLLYHDPFINAFSASQFRVNHCLAGVIAIVLQFNITSVIGIHKILIRYTL